MSMKLFFIIKLIILFSELSKGGKIFINNKNKFVELKIPQGKIRGTVEKTIYGKEYASFQGIPYAQPPLGDLRFKEPKPLLNWEGVLDATKQPNICIQLAGIYDGTNDTTVVGEEDCLYLTVASPKIKTKQLLPVMAWIHGGAYISGSGTYQLFKPDYLLTQDIVLVMFNYRLNSFGFLSIEDENFEVYGNAGLKDQILALKWIKDNIKYFGGNPNLVTIFGESAGGVSVNLLLLSPIAKGLFHRAIYQSGTGTTPWAFKKSIYKDLLEVLSCNQNQTEFERFKCLNSKSSLEIFNAQQEIQNRKENFGKILAGPIVEQHSKGQKFIAETPDSIISKSTFNQIPVMAGCTLDEGAMALVQPSFFPVKIDFKNNEDLIPVELNLKRGSNESVELGNRIKKFYWGDSIPSAENDEPFVKYQTDTYFTYKISRTTKAIAEKATNDVFYYKFSYHEINDVSNKSEKYVAHGYELPFLFYEPGTIDLNDKMPTSVYRIITFWVNFAKYGNPNPPKNDRFIDVKWLPISNDQFNYINIDHKLECLIEPEKERMNFWDQIYHKFKKRFL